jgi:hypothetical protein
VADRHASTPPSDLAPLPARAREEVEDDAEPVRMTAAAVGMGEADTAALVNRSLTAGRAIGAAASGASLPALDQSESSDRRLRHGRLRRMQAQPLVHDFHNCIGVDRKHVRQDRLDALCEV